MLRFAIALGLSALVSGPFVRPALAAKAGLCGFDPKQLSFDGTPDVQAACLLRRVRPQGAGSDPQPIPDWLSQRVAKKVEIGPAALNKYLAGQKITADKVGGPIQEKPDLGERKYFVIHDTSYPEYKGTSVADFPPDLNAETWDGNTLTGWVDVSRKVNAITNRSGDSRTFNDFAATRPETGVKLELKQFYPSSKKLFLHVENIQPRVKPPKTWAHIAPDPGFTPAQLKRLALLYLTASVRSGLWLIPALHFNIDDKLPLKKGQSGHDDPQNFDLAAWVKAIEGIVSEIGQ
jgi:hypothetical protein